jgi:hypothetical protein
MSCFESPGRYQPSPAEKLILQAFFQTQGDCPQLNPFAPGLKTLLFERRQIGDSEACDCAGQPRRADDA